VPLKIFAIELGTNFSSTTLGPAQSGKFFNHDGREYAW